MMPRFYLRLLLIPFLLFSTALLIVRAQAYDNLELSQLLLPEGCPAPCFMGIRPQATTMDDAVQILKANPWVQAVDYDQTNNPSGYISWTWSDQQPSWIIGEDRGEIRGADNLVKAITVYTNIPLGDTQLVLGPPEFEIIDPERDQEGLISLYMAFYSRRGLLIENWQRCQVTEPLRNKVIIKVSAASTTANSKPIHSLKDLFRVC